MAFVVFNFKDDVGNDFVSFIQSDTGDKVGFFGFLRQDDIRSKGGGFGGFGLGTGGNHSFSFGWRRLFGFRGSLRFWLRLSGFRSRGGFSWGLGLGRWRFRWGNRMRHGS